MKSIEITIVRRENTALDAMGNLRVWHVVADATSFFKRQHSNGRPSEARARIIRQINDSIKNNPFKI